MLLKLKTIYLFPAILATSLVLFISLGATQAQAATYYVATTGNDINPGTESAPFRNIQKAADIVKPGDVVIVEDGVYTSSSKYILSLNRGGNASNWITFKARNNHKVILDGVNNSTNHACICLFDNAAYIKIEGMILRRAENVGIHANSAANNIHIYNNIIHNIGQKIINHTYGISGVFSASLTRKFTLERNIIYDVGRLPGGVYSDGQNHDYRHDHGFYAQGKGHIIINNLFYNCKAGWGLKLDGHYALEALKSDEYTHIIKNNVFCQLPNAGSAGGWITQYRNYGTSSVYGDRKVGRVWAEGNSFVGDPSGNKYPYYIGSDTTSRNWPGTVLKNNICSAANLYNPAIANNITDINNTVKAPESILSSKNCVLPGPCTPSCTGKTCGPDGCGGSCGTCQSGQTCNSSGQCVSSISCKEITLADFTLFISSYKNNEKGCDLICDLNKDCQITIADFTTLLKCFEENYKK